MTIAFIGNAGGLLVAHRSHGSWQTTVCLEGKPVVCVVADPEHPEYVYCGTQDHGLWCSIDAGVSWQPAGQGVEYSYIASVAVSRSERVAGVGVVYAGTGPTRVYRSEDGGTTWQSRSGLIDLPSAATWSFPPRPDTHHARWIALDPHMAGRLWVSAEAGATVRSDDAGATWVDRNADTPFDAHTVRTHVLAPGRLYAAAGDGFMQPGHGYFSSRDAGATWQVFGAGLAHHYLWGLAVDPADPDTIVVSAAEGPQQAHRPAAGAATVYRSAAGEPWQNVQPDPSGSSLAYTLSANPAEPGSFYAVSNLGLFYSKDAGLTWDRQELGAAGHALAYGAYCLDVVDG